MSAMQLGIGFPGGLPLRDAVDVVVEAERMGYTECWTSEVAGHDAFTPLAAVAARTTTIGLGTAVVPAATRPPAVLAMTAATLQELSGGRFRLGLGSSTPAIVSRWMGLPFPPPLERMRETVSTVRAMTDGEKVVIHGKTLSVDGFRLDMPPQPMSVYVGALGPRMTRLAGEISDGLVLTMSSPRFIPQMLADFNAGAERAGRNHGGLNVVLSVPVVCDEPDAVDLVRDSVAAYGVLDLYNRYLARQGFEQEAANLRDAFARRSRADARTAVTARMTSELSVTGDVVACRKQLSVYEMAGVKTLLLSPLTRVAEPKRRMARLLDILQGFV
jgi:probable F420-dependent oxidoreductase